MSAGPGRGRASSQVARRITLHLRFRVLAFASIVAIVGGGVLAAADAPGSPTGLTASFALPSDALPAGTLGGSELSVASGGRAAEFEVWAEAGAPTYFLDALQFSVHAGASTGLTLAASFSSDVSSLPNGSEVFALLGTPAPASSGLGLGGSLSPSSSSPGGELQALNGLGGPEGSMPGLLTGIDVSSSGVVVVGNSSLVSLALPSGGAYLLVLSLGVLIPAEAPGALSGFVLTLSISLTRSL